MNPELMIVAGVGGGIVLLIGLLAAAKEYNDDQKGPRRIGRNWFATEIPSEWRDRSRRTLVYENNDRPSRGRSKRKTMKK